MSGVVRKTNLGLSDVNAQHNSLTGAQLASGLVVHTSVTGGGNITMDTAANIIANCGLGIDGDTVWCIYINDGNQTLTFVTNTGITLADSGQTIASNESAIVFVKRTSSTTCTVYVVGA